MKHIYRYRAVAFLDVLGFQGRLIGFNQEAEENRFSESNELADSEYYYSESASKFIRIVEGALMKLPDEKFKYYLFSDNICITSLAETTPEDLKDLLLIISELFYDFAINGYFLRGGIDYGLFIDDDNLALGVPLAEAYKMESKLAIYPRILLSQKLVDRFIEEDEFKDDLTILLISKSHEYFFLNVFSHVFQSDYREDKQDYFESLKSAVEKELKTNLENEKLYLRYKWFAQIFNQFIDSFVTNLAYQDNSFDPDEEEGYLDFIVSQKIDYAK